MYTRYQSAECYISTRTLGNVRYEVETIAIVEAVLHIGGVCGSYGGSARLEGYNYNVIVHISDNWV